MTARRMFDRAPHLRRLALHWRRYNGGGRHCAWCAFRLDGIGVVVDATWVVCVPCLGRYGGKVTPYDKPGKRPGVWAYMAAELLRRPC